MKTPAQTAYDDQAGAAANEAAATMTRLVDPLGGAIRRNVNTPWLVAFITSHNAAVDAGLGGRCPHLTTPQPCYAAAWKPGFVVCQECAKAGFLHPDSDAANWTCDRCNRYRPSRIAVSAIQTDRFIMFIGLCPECRRD